MKGPTRPHLVKAARLDARSHLAHGLVLLVHPPLLGCPPAPRALPRAAARLTLGRCGRCLAGLGGRHQVCQLRRVARPQPGILLQKGEGPGGVGG